MGRGRRDSRSRSRGRGRGRGDRDSRSRGRDRRGGGGRDRRGGKKDAENKGPDHRPDVERRKGGVKLFCGRVPQEATEREIRDVFEHFGEVLEVFKMRGERPGEERHSLYHEDGLTCAFIRMESLSAAEQAIASLHDKGQILKNKRDTGPIQVAFAKGEAVRLGLNQRKEALPNRLEGKELVRQLKERAILEAPDKQSFKFNEFGNPFWFPTDPLIKIVHIGRESDRMFENCWRHYCSEGWGGTYELDPELMPHHGLVQFVMMRTVDYGDADWFLRIVKETHALLKAGQLASNKPREVDVEAMEKKLAESRQLAEIQARGGKIPQQVPEQQQQHQVPEQQQQDAAGSKQGEQPVKLNEDEQNDSDSDAVDYGDI